MRRSTILLMAMALIVAACSGGDGGETTSGPSPPTIAPAPAPVSTSPVPSSTLGALSTTSTMLPAASTSSPPAQPGAVLAGNQIEPELICRDITELGGIYPDAVAYWVVERRPDRMDDDGDGIPCETVYPKADVDAFYHPGGVEMPSGLFCRDLEAEELPLSYAVAYWLLEGAPARMDADRNGIPCETVYPAEDFEAFFPVVSRWQSFTNGNQIADVAVAADGTVWAVGYGGAVHWDPVTAGYTKYLVEDGLASNAVNAVAVADDGMVWLATMSGASSFDGETWRRYLREEPFYSVLAASDGSVWLGGSEVVVVLGGSGMTRFTYEDGLSTEIRSLAEGGDGAIYAATGGCCCEDCVDFHGESAPDVLAILDGHWRSLTSAATDDRDVSSELLYGGSELMVDAAGVVWATAYDPNLLAFDGTTWTGHPAQPPEASEADWFWAATMDPRGMIWASGRDGLVRFDRTSATSISFPGETGHITSLTVDPTTGTLWAGTYDGLGAYDGEAWMWYRTADQLPHNDAGPLAVDNGDLWVGTAGGLSRRTGTGWTTFTTETLIDGVSVGSIAVTSDGTVWAGNWNSLSWFDGVTWHAEGGPGGGVPHEGSGLYGAPLAAGHDGTVWALGRRGGDPMLYDNGEWSEHPLPDACRGINRMAVDTDGTLWTVGGCRALCSYDGASWTTHFEGACWDPIWEPEPDVAYPGNVLALTIDPSGLPVISTDQAGLLRWDDTRWLPINVPAASPSVATDMAFGPDGSIWTLHGSDLLAFFDGSWESIPTEPFANLRVSAIAVDEEGAVWIGTQAGLFAVPPMGTQPSD